MPKDYLEERARQRAKGKSMKEAKTTAAKITNARRRAQGKPPMKPHKRPAGKR